MLVVQNSEGLGMPKYIGSYTLWAVILQKKIILFGLVILTYELVTVNQGNINFFLIF